jgi:hypothetical protein
VVGKGGKMHLVQEGLKEAKIFKEAVEKAQENAEGFDILVFEDFITTTGTYKIV